MGKLKADEIIKLLDLKPLEGEGGYSNETYRSEIILPKESLPEINEERSLGTAIFYLVTEESYSSMHKLDSDEIFHFYMGDPCEQLHLFEDGTSEIYILGNNIRKNEKIQLLAPKNVWQGTRLIKGGKHGWALLGTTMHPGYEDSGFEVGNKEDLIKKYPSRRKIIDELTGPIKFDC